MQRYFQFPSRDAIPQSSDAVGDGQIIADLESLEAYFLKTRRARSGRETLYTRLTTLASGFI